MSMNVVFAPDSFKGSVAAHDVAHALAAGWLTARPDDEVAMMPMADGGEGTIAAFLAAMPDAEFVDVAVTGADGEIVDAGYVILDDGTAVVELGLCCGIEQLGNRRAPVTATTRGFGEAIAAALDAGATSLVLGIGSSASTDGGAGMLTALGARILDGDGRELDATPHDMMRAVAIDLTGLRAVPAGGVRVLSDVTNPLLGERGAAAVFAPQKGADADQVRLLDAALAHGATLLAHAAAASGLTVVSPMAEGTGAAGGTGFALQSWGAVSTSGAEAIASLIGLDDVLADADLVVTGEGAFDGQSAAGKVAEVVRARADAHGVATALVAGRIAADADLRGFVAHRSLIELAGSESAALTIPDMFLAQAGGELARDTARD